MVSMGEMIGNIAHQWRQPLSVISTAATGMQMQKEYGVLTDEQFNSSCEAIDKQSQYLSKTIDDFRNFIKGDREKRLFKLEDEIESFLSLIHGSVKSNDINIILELQKDLYIDGYQNELTQCFINLFNNSKDAFNENNVKNRLIFISSKNVNDKIEIKFKDNAGGVPNDVLHKIFEPYFTTKHNYQGTGLGLHMTYNLIVNGMQGDINIKNVEYEYMQIQYYGANFTIYL